MSQLALRLVTLLDPARPAEPLAAACLLLGHTERRSVADLFRRATTAVCLASLLESGRHGSETARPNRAHNGQQTDKSEDGAEMQNGTRHEIGTKNGEQNGMGMGHETDRDGQLASERKIESVPPTGSGAQLRYHTLSLKDEQNDQQNGQQNDEQNNQQNGKQNGEQNNQQNGEQNSQQNGKQNGKQNSQQNGQQNGEQNNQQNGQQKGEQNNQQNGEHNGEQNNQQNGEQNGEQNNKQKGQQKGQQNSTQSIQENGQQNDQTDGQQRGEQDDHKALSECVGAPSRVEETAAVLLHWLQSLPCNAHEVCEQVRRGADAELAEVGAAVYPTVSLLNHACDPNVLRVSHGTACVVRVIRPIAAGQELLDNYGFHWAVQGWTERQEALRRQYYFTCACRACAEDWPRHDELPDREYLRCEICCASEAPPVYCYHEKDAAAAAQYAKSRKKYLRAMESRGQDGVVRDIAPLVRHLDVMNRLLTMPSREFNSCQEAVKLSFFEEGNCCTEEETDKKEVKQNGTVERTQNDTRNCIERLYGKNTRVSCP